MASSSEKTLTEDQIQQALKQLETVLREPNVTYAFYRSVKRTTKPGDEWETYAPGHGRRITIEVPCKKGEYYQGPGGV